MEATTLDLERRLRFAGLRVTRARTTVLAAVHAHPHADADMVMDAARRTLSDLSRQAVHDSLRALVEVGLVRQFQLGPVVRFEAWSPDDAHHHAVCTSCGRITNVDCVGDGPSCLSPADSRGFHVRAVEVVYRGLCSDCAGRPTENPRSTDLAQDDRRPSHAWDEPSSEPLVKHRLDTVVGAAVRSSSYPSSRHARISRVVAGPRSDPLSGSQPGSSETWSHAGADSWSQRLSSGTTSQPGPPDVQPLTEMSDGWSRRESDASTPLEPVPQADDRPAAGTAPEHQPPRMDGPPEGRAVADGPVPSAALEARPAWFPTETLPARPAVDALVRPAAAAEAAAGASGTGSPSPVSQALPTRRRALREASRPQPV